MTKTTRQLIERLFGTVPRELVRIGFTVWAVNIFIGATPQTAADCKSKVIGIHTNATQIFAVILILVVGLGVPIVMKLGEKYLQKKAT